MPDRSPPIRFPAPIRGLNTVAPPPVVPDLQALRLVNMVGGELGLQTRLGWREWAIGFSGLASDAIRTIIPFSGTAARGAGDRIFCANDRGIYDVTTSGLILSSPDVTFASSTGEAGFIISTVMTTAAGAFLMVCDEENGLYRYTEDGGTWTTVPSGVAAPWTSSTTVLVGDRVVNGGNVYVCDTAGVTATSGGPTGSASNIVDGTARWDYVSAAVPGAIGPSLADQRAGLTLDPRNFVFATVWKSRLWLVERGSSRAWYLEAGAITGVATSFDFGVKMRQGGPLVGLWNWSYDGGGGLDTLLVGVSAAGDVVIYQGTDPASASTFGLKGCWSLGGVPEGRRIATDFGGDILMLSTLGAIPLSKLVLGVAIEDAAQYQTRDIQPLFNRFVSQSGHVQGWALALHPTDNTLLVLVPDADGEGVSQLAMSFATKGWSQYEDMPMYSAGTWNGQLYFGTTDGRVCVNDGVVDARLLTDPNAYSPIAWKVLTSFRDMGGVANKHPTLARVHLYSPEVQPTAEVTARFDFDVSEPDEPTLVVGSSGWGFDLWGTGEWSDGQGASQRTQGVVGAGRDVGLWVMGQALTRTTLVAVDLYTEVGGLW